jgi:hypothetical protein
LYIICNLTTSKKHEDKTNIFCSDTITNCLKFRPIYEPKTKEPELKIIEKNKKEDNLIFCEGLLSMEMNSSYNKLKSEIFSIVIPLSIPNIASLGILFILILFGTFYLLKIITRKKCHCKICKIVYKIVEHLGEGGFGEVGFKYISNN